MERRLSDILLPLCRTDRHVPSAATRCGLHWSRWNVRRARCWCSGAVSPASTSGRNSNPP